MNNDLPLQSKIAPAVDKFGDAVQHDRITGGINALGIRVIRQYHDAGIVSAGKLQIKVIAGKDPVG